ncbi:hypothetical protein GCM10008995_10370 [Halobellus salinus]|uniref:Uncharacterized protein n=1 Tax=Halobellus salinus TaxID=931585 RepID=A0A830E8S3_9EURY|nr:hypothetical protein [Halobellus salinus]GGJ02509.1 hypothetical protein GCM10008995_10370 [Halobellus salinus]SMP16919.1 hypothetical protein SAMN06265347_10640 [Halobellus salinus]
MSKRPGIRAVALLLVVLTAGCGTTAYPTDNPEQNATLPGYDPGSDVSPVETRAFWDRSSNWEDPDVRNATVTSRAYAYPTLRGTDAAVVYTTPKKPYVESDRPRSMSPVELAALATRSVDTPLPGTDSRRVFSGTLLDREVPVQALTDGNGTTTGYVAHVATSDAVVVVVVVVAGGADRRTVTRVLSNVTLNSGVAAAG